MNERTNDPDTLLLPENPFSAPSSSLSLPGPFVLDIYIYLLCAFALILYLF